MNERTYSITLDAADREHIDQVLATPGVNSRLHSRACVLKMLGDGVSAPEIALEASVSRSSVYAVARRYQEGGLLRALYDGRSSGTPRKIPISAFKWMADVMVMPPRVLGIPMERWTITALQAYLRTEGPKNGWPELARLSRSYVWRIFTGDRRIECEQHQPSPQDIQNAAGAHVVIREEIRLSTIRRYGRWQLLPETSVLARLDISGEPATEPLSFIVGFDSGSDALHVIQGSGDRDADMLAFLEEVDRNTPDGVMIELLEEPDAPEPSQAVCKYLFSRTGRFSLVRNRHAEHLRHVKMISEALLYRNRPFDAIRAKTRSELADRILVAARTYRVHEILAKAVAAHLDQSPGHF